MIKKSDIIICAWISLLLEKHCQSNEICYKNAIFTRMEIQNRATEMLGNDRQIRDNEFLNLTVGKGTSTSQKFFLKSGEGALEIYYRLSFPGEICEYNISEYIDILLNNNFFNNIFSMNATAIEIESVLRTYFELMKSYNQTRQGECSDIIAKEAIWIAAATASYNEYHRTYSCDGDEYYFAQFEIAKIAYSFNKNNSLDTCRQMTRFDCTEREPYLVANEQRRRLSHWYEKNNVPPVTNEDFFVVTVDGYKLVSEIISFAKSEYTSIFLPELMLSNSSSIEEMENHAASLSNDLLKIIARDRETDAILEEERVVQRYRRDPYISHYAKRWANGVCQLCREKAPFKNANGEPYLESHHIIPLSDGGRDAIDNVVALCPNCHRKMHILKKQTDVDALLVLSNQASEGNL